MEENNIFKSIKILGIILGIISTSIWIAISLERYGVKPFMTILGIAALYCIIIIILVVHGYIQNSIEEQIYKILRKEKLIKEEKNKVK